MRVRRKRRCGLRAALAAVAGVALALASAPVEAAFMSGFIGHSHFGEPDAGADGHVSFAVYQTSDSDWTDDFAGVDSSAIRAAAGSGAVNSDAAYVYFYQVVNTNADTSAEDTLSSLIVPTIEHTSFGLFDAVLDTVFSSSTGGFVFSDSSLVGSGTEALGADGSGFDAAGDQNPNVDNESLAVASAFAADDGAKTLASYGSVGASGGVEFGLNLNGVGQYSTILWLTSNEAPRYEVGTLVGSEAQGDIPTPTPVPASLAMLLGGLPGFAGLGLVLRRKRETVAA